VGATHPNYREMEQLGAQVWREASMTERNAVETGIDVSTKAGIMTMTVDDMAAALRDAGWTCIPPVAAMCPFGRDDHGLAPEDPCPVCGDLGTFDEVGEVSRCVKP
jgi:hypothetical protein